MKDAPSMTTSGKKHYMASGKRQANWALELVPGMKLHPYPSHPARV